MPRAARLRLDRLLVERGLVPTREKARAAILAGLVSSRGVRIDKPGTILAEDAEIAVAPGRRFVGRGGEKIEGLLESIALDVRGARVLDVGASTGGFTDCLLQHGADGVVALDVGRGQLDWKLRNDPRVTVVEGVNVRYLDPALVTGPFDLIVVDVSFISLRLVLPVLFPLLPDRPAPDAPGPPLLSPDVGAPSCRPGAVPSDPVPAPSGAGAPSTEPGSSRRDASPGRSGAAPSLAALPMLLALLKPQFEVGRGQVGKGGIVTDPRDHERVLLEVSSAARLTPGCPGLQRIVESRIRGAEGNREFFLCFHPGPGLGGRALEEEVRRVVSGSLP